MKLTKKIENTDPITGDTHVAINLMVLGARGEKFKNEVEYEVHRQLSRLDAGAVKILRESCDGSIVIAIEAESKAVENARGAGISTFAVEIDDDSSPLTANAAVDAILTHLIKQIPAGTFNSAESIREKFNIERAEKGDERIDPALKDYNDREDDEEEQEVLPAWLTEYKANRAADIEKTKLETRLDEELLKTGAEPHIRTRAKTLIEKDLSRFTPDTVGAEVARVVEILNSALT